MHYTFAVSLQEKIFSGDDVSLGSTRLSIRHLLTMQSGLIVHLYNILEALMSRATKMVEEAFGSVPPRTWSIDARREWLREHGVSRIEGGAEETRLKSFEMFSAKLLTDGPLGPQNIRKPSGTWNDRRIDTFAKRLGVPLQIEPDLYRKMAKKDHLGEKTPVTFLADRRNDLAHGLRSFEEGAKELTLANIREIADVTLEYMEVVVNAFQAYIDQKLFVATA